MLTDLARRSRPSLIAATALYAAACAETGGDVETLQDAVVSENGWAANGWAANGWAANGWAANGWAANGFSAYGFSLNGVTTSGFGTNGFATGGFASNGSIINGFTGAGFTSNGAPVGGWNIDGLQTAAGLSHTSGLMTAAGGREFIKYLVKVAFPAGTSLTVQDNALPPNTYTFPGVLGVAPELQTGSCDLTCQERVSAAMLAHVNNSGLHVGIWLVGPDAGIGWDTSPDFPYQEGAYFGNLFAPNPHGNYCAGANLSAGAAKGRLGAAIVNNSILNCPYGSQWDPVSNQNVPVSCANGSNNFCAASGGGFTSCQDGVPQTPYASGHAWQHVVTVFRNFEPTQLYKICNKVNKCLGVVSGSTADGASVEQRAYSGALGQTWQILQVSPGLYKIINRTSGMSLDLNGVQVVQHPFTGAASQTIPIGYISSEPGRANLFTSSMLNGAMMMPQQSVSSSDGALIQAITGYPRGSGSSDPARWAFIPIGLATFDPGRTTRLVPQNATGSSLDVCNGSTTNGSCIQIYQSWNGDMQKFIVADAGNGNVKIALKLNPAKCIGPLNNGTTAGTSLVVQDCNGSLNQAWITGELGAGSGLFAYRNAAAANLCMDVTGGSSANGARMELYTCTGANNQLFQTQVAP